MALTSGVMLAGLVRCTPPPPPPGPTANPTKIGFVHGAFVAVPPGTLDHAALIASLKELEVSTVLLEAAADATGGHVDDRVALAIELQRELDATVYIGTYQSSTRNGQPMDALLAKDPAFTSCYAGGLALDAETSIIDKLRLCSQDASRRVADALRVANASAKIGCFIAHQPEHVDRLDDESRTKLEAFFRDAASACAAAARPVALSPVLTRGSGDPGQGGLFLRGALQDSGVSLLVLQDGVSTLDASATRAAPYYQGLRNALADRPPPVAVFGAVEAFACATPDCTTRAPADSKRLIAQLCAARARVEGIVVPDYVQDFAGRPLVQADAAADASTADASLRDAYLAWRDAGGPCP